jgi:hypothetical protein
MSGAGEPNENVEVSALDVDGVNAVRIGTLLWLVIFLVSLVARDWFTDQGLTRLPEISASGVGLGLLGLLYVLRRRRSINR